MEDCLAELADGGDTLATWTLILTGLQVGLTRHEIDAAEDWAMVAAMIDLSPLIP